MLADDRAGHANQALGVADALGLPYEVKTLAYTARARLPNSVIGASLGQLTGPARAAIAPPWPALVIAAGRRTAPVARAILCASGGHTKLVQCMWPGVGVNDFDLIAVPEHDRVRDRANLLRTIGAPHRVTRARLAEAEAQWRTRLAHVPAPRLALLVGGGTRRHAFTLDHARRLAERVAALAGALGAAVMMTTSRRTPARVRDLLIEALAPRHRHDWGAPGDNPYLGYLALADAIVVTGDSTAMCTEACASGHPVLIEAAAGAGRRKHRALHARLYALGCAAPLADALAAGALPAGRGPRLDDAGTVAAAIRERLGQALAPAAEG